jgi:uncharacterized membrane protein (UPF0127 family)
MSNKSALLRLAAVAVTFAVSVAAAGLSTPAVAQTPSAQNAENLDHFPHMKAVITTSSGAEHFEIWLADTPARSEQGLMFVRSLAHDKGMLFPRNTRGPMAMWMKNTLIPLDMLFVDGHGQIIYIRRNATPQSEAIISIPAPIVTPADAVLELAGGECDRRHISQGDRVTISREN